MRLKDVFGIANEVSYVSYVDRGGLDDQFRYLLGVDRHIAIHGDSKQGKSWLRRSLLDSDRTIAVQCQPDTLPESIFAQALGHLGVSADLKRTGRTSLHGELDFTAGGEIGLPLLAKAKLEVEGAGGVERETESESQPVGRTPGDLMWVATTLHASEKRLVVEDFHYVSDECRESFAFLLKALGDYGVYVILVGIWPDESLLTYINGDLDGRIENLHLMWDADELGQVLRKGAAALNVEMADELRSQLVEDAYGNVGLLQRLAEQACLAAGVREDTTGKPTRIESHTLDPARRAISRQMRPRFQKFADDFVRGMKRMPPGQGLMVYKHLLRAFTDATAAELLAGIDSRELLRRVQASEDGARIRPSDLTQALERVAALQVKLNISPLVLTYERQRRKLFLADRSFLFYREHGSPIWPWQDDEAMDAALASAEPGEPLTLFDDTGLVA
jgi:hypothetical protein